MSSGPKGYAARSMRFLAPKTATFVCISDYIRKLLKNYHLPEEKLQRIYCATDTQVEKEYPSRLRDDLNISVDTPVVGSTGVWRPNKGFTYFIAACELVTRSQPLAHFLLGGKAYSPDAAFATTIWVRGQFLRAGNCLDFTGYQEDVGRFLSALDIFVLPSDCEAFGLVAVEAMARGIPVVATAAGGVPEIVVHGETGYLVPPRNPEAMAAAILKLLSDPLRAMQMGESGKARVRRLFEQRNMVREYEALYERLAREAGKP
jgi:glycosyltransferase involved in cell wall biosynthesis